MAKKIEIKKGTSKKDVKPKKRGADKTMSKPKAKTKKADDTKALKSKLKQKGSEIKNLKKEIEELKTEYLRQLADKENLRKRLEREKTEFYQHALSEAMTELLTVLDNFERALQTEVQGDEDSFREGVEMIYRQYLSVLTKQGIQPIEIKDNEFDPRFHQAFATQESADVSKPQVAEEFQKGYMLNDRLLRPALVKVIVPIKEKE